MNPLKGHKNDRYWEEWNKRMAQELAKKLGGSETFEEWARKENEGNPLRRPDGRDGS